MTQHTYTTKKSARRQKVKGSSKFCVCVSEKNDAISLSLSCSQSVCRLLAIYVCTSQIALYERGHLKTRHSHVRLGVINARANARWERESKKVRQLAPKITLNIRSSAHAVAFEHTGPSPSNLRSLL